MDTFIVTFEAVATLLLIGIVGFYVISRKVLPENALSILATLTIDIALPSLVFVNIVTTFDPVVMTGWWLLPLSFLAFMVGAFILAKVLTFLLLSKHKGEFSASLFFQNAVFFPLAILSSWHCCQDELLVKLFLFTLLFAPLYFCTAGFFFSKGGNEVNKAKVFNPVLIATILSMSIVFIGMDRFVPDFAISSLLLVGKMAAPLLMLIFGGSIYLDYRDKGRLEFLEVAKFVLAKNIIFPAVMVTVLAFVRLEYELSLLLVLQASVPPITSLPVLAKHHGGNIRIINQFMIASFLLSLLTIPLFVMIFEKLYAS